VLPLMDARDLAVSFNSISISNLVRIKRLTSM
jgi:hypothetical protein